MSIRCGCPDQGDDIVFGPQHNCARTAVLGEPLPPAPEWMYPPDARPLPCEGVLDDEERCGR